MHVLMSQDQSDLLAICQEL
uniref:Uncharacterized protein n=1 Tax=Arundo donax TaxID=35708 RepID=A0A0A9AQT9_ARUDO